MRLFASFAQGTALLFTNPYYTLLSNCMIFAFRETHTQDVGESEGITLYYGMANILPKCVLQAPFINGPITLSS